MEARGDHGWFTRAAPWTALMAPVPSYGNGVG
jgi:hypothetical protein